MNTGRIGRLWGVSLLAMTLSGTAAAQDQPAAEVPQDAAAGAEPGH